MTKQKEQPEKEYDGFREYMTELIEAKTERINQKCGMLEGI
jgi:hypothetical protein